MPKPLVHFTRGENERRMYAHAERVMRAVWDAAGAREVWAFPRDAHTIDTCPHRCIAPDLRGFGRSPPPPVTCSR